MQTVLYVDAFAEEGGAEVALRTLLSHLDSGRFRPVVVFLSPGPFATQVRAMGLRAYVLPRHRRRHVLHVLRAILIITWITRREKVNIIHSNGFGPHLYGSIVGTFAGCPTVWQLYDPPSAPSWWQAIILWLHLRLPTNRHVFMADTTRDAYLRERRVPESTTLYPASDRVSRHPKPANATASVRTQFDLEDSARIILTLARLQPSKGHDVLLRAVPRVLQEFPNARFLIVGASLFGLNEEYGQRIRDTARQMGLENRVIFTGFCDEETVLSLLCSCEMLVHPALGEPFGLAITEAMAAGKPVVATRVEGPARIVLDGQTGLLVEPADAEELASAICRLLRDPADAHRMGQRGRERVAALYSAKAMAAGMQKVYEGVRYGKT